MSQQEQIFRHCGEWADRVHALLHAPGIYIFGSTVHRDGAQFDLARSDLDLVVLLPADLVFAPQRKEWLVKLRDLKHQLELSLIPLLGRSDASEPIVSIVAATEFEVSRDIHKSGSRDFFRVNTFRDLLAEELSLLTLAQGESIPIDDFGRQVFSFVQGVRNKFLAVSASRNCALQPWDDESDPIPKELMRFGAIAEHVSRSTPTNLAFDVQVGLDSLSQYLYLERDSHEDLRRLHEWLSIRRGARGSSSALSPEDHLLFAEVLFDMMGPADPSVERAAKPAWPPHPARRVELAPALPALFSITARQMLGGTEAEISATVDEAMVNLAWGREPAFTLRMEEVETIDHRLSDLQAEDAPTARRERAALTDRRNRVSLAAPRIERAIRDALFYQYLLFPKRVFGESRARHLIETMNVVVRRSFDYLTDGGYLEGWKVLSDDRRFVIQFSLPKAEESRWLRKRGLASVIELAADNPEIHELPRSLIAQFFCPELLLKIAELEVRGRDFPAASDREWVLNLEGWRFGPK